MINLENAANEMRSFTDAVPQDYPPRQEVVRKVAQLETTVSEIREKIKASATKKEIREIREIVENATRIQLKWIADADLFLR